MGLCLLLLFYCLLIYEAICVQIHKNYKVDFWPQKDMHICTDITDGNIEVKIVYNIEWEVT